MKKKIQYKAFAVLAAAALFLLILPMLAAGLFAVPCADDFSYGAPAHLAYLETGSVTAALLAGAGKVAETYQSWQGSFSAVFLMAMQPAVFSESLYALTPAIMLAALLLGVFCFCSALLCGVFGMDKNACVTVACVICALCTQLVPSPVQGFYWYNGAVYYVLFFGLSLLWMALCIRSALRGGTVRLVFACVLAVLVGGGNYVTALSCSILGVSAAVLLRIKGTPLRKKALLPVLFLLISFAVSMAAPGNTGREASVYIRTGAVQAILRSFESGAVYGIKWLSLPLAGLMAFLAPILWKEAAASDFAFRYPLPVTLYSFCLFSAMFCPPLYAMGDIGELRLLNIIYFAYVMLVTLNLFYWLGWAAHRRGADGKRGGVRLCCAVCLAAAALVCCAVPARTMAYTSLSAIGLLRSGEGRAYHDCALRRYEILHDSSVRDAELEYFPSQPYLLYYDDIRDDPEDWHNIDMSHYYGKNTVRTVPKNPTGE